MTHCCIKSILYTMNDLVSLYKESIYFRVFVIVYLLSTIGTLSFGSFCISDGHYFPQGCWIIFTIGCLLSMMLVVNLLIFFLADCAQTCTNDDLDSAERGESRNVRNSNNARESRNVRNSNNIRESRNTRESIKKTTNVLSSTDNIKKLSKRELVQIVEELTEDDSDGPKEITESKYKSPKKLKNKKKKVVESETEESEIEESPKKEKKIEKTKKSSVLSSDPKSDEKIKEDPTKFTQENPIVKIKKEEITKVDKETTKVDKETKIEKKK